MSGGVGWVVETETFETFRGSGKDFGFDNIVNAFAGAMRHELLRNAKKGGWSAEDPLDLIQRLGEAANELQDAVMRRAPAEEVLSEAADVANFAMMVADVYPKGHWAWVHNGIVLVPLRADQKEVQE